MFNNLLNPFNPISLFFIGRAASRNNEIDNTETIQIVPCNSPKTVIDSVQAANDKSAYLDLSAFILCALMLILGFKLLRRDWL